MIAPIDPPTSRLELQVELHQATRAEHASLNRTIMARLPLCTSPSVANPLAYTAGLITFGHIYIAFERAWNSLLEQENHKLDQRQRDLLLILRTQHIARTERLRHDLDSLSSNLGPDASQFLENLHTKSQYFASTIQDSIQAKPHVTLAYAWTMYLALFNGGRWIVTQLLSSDKVYWFDEQSSEVISDKYLSFWFFDDSPRDAKHGETVKIDLKRNFSAAADLLSDTEKDDVIAESKMLFKMCADMVEILDQELASLPAPVAQASTVLPGESTHESTTSHVLVSYMATVLPVSNIWRSLRAVVGYSTTDPHKSGTIQAKSDVRHCTHAPRTDTIEA